MRRRPGHPSRTVTLRIVGTHAIGRSSARLHTSPLRKAPPQAHAPYAGRMTGSGRSPGSRVSAVVRLPERRLAALPQWHRGQRLTADSCGGSFGLVTADGSKLPIATAPNSLLAGSRRHLGRGCNETSSRGVVNGARRAERNETGISTSAWQTGDNGLPPAPNRRPGLESAAPARAYGKNKSDDRAARLRSTLRYADDDSTARHPTRPSPPQPCAGRSTGHRKPHQCAVPLGADLIGPARHDRPPRLMSHWTDARAKPIKGTK